MFTKSKEGAMYLMLIVLTIITFALVIALNIQRSNAKVMAISVINDFGHTEAVGDTLYYYPNNKDIPVSTGTKEALKYYGRGFSTVVIK